jgi:hypothetical protein
MDYVGIFVCIIGFFWVTPIMYMYWFSPKSFTALIRGQDKYARRQVFYALYKPWFTFLKTHHGVGIWLGRIVSLMMFLGLFLALYVSIWGPLQP